MERAAACVGRRRW